MSEEIGSGEIFENRECLSGDESRGCHGAVFMSLVDDQCEFLQFIRTYIQQ